MERQRQGWLVFAATVLGIAGVVRFFDSISAFRFHGALPQNIGSAAFGTGLKTSGWIYLAVGIVLVACARGVVVCSRVSRWVGIVAGSVMATSASWWTPFHLVWSLVAIALGMLAVYSLAQIGGPVQATM